MMMMNFGYTNRTRHTSGLGQSGWDPNVLLPEVSISADYVKPYAGEPYPNPQLPVTPGAGTTALVQSGLYTMKTGVQTFVSDEAQRRQMTTVVTVVAIALVAYLFLRR